MKLKQTILNRLTNQTSTPENRTIKRKQSQDKNFKIPLNKIQQTRVMNKKNGCIKGYSANTYHGLVRNYNEDRVSIILNITKPDATQRWPKCSYFAIFDGHGGSLCSDFLRDNMHKYIIQDKNFPFKPIEALKAGFEKAEQQFKKLAQLEQPINKSGSCAIIVLIIDKNCYVANVGDSRAIMSTGHGKRIIALSEDHKPNSPNERERIIKNGGSIYQSNITTKSGAIMPGPHRIFPGRLSVSRALGDIQAKDQKYEGNPFVLISEPEIKHIEIEPSEHDFIVIGCDGIFDKLTNEEIIEVVWRSEQKSLDKDNFIGLAISNILLQSMNKKSMDNITAVLILFDKQYQKTLTKVESKKSVSSSNIIAESNRSQKRKSKDIYKVIQNFNKQSNTKRRSIEPKESRSKQNQNMLSNINNNNNIRNKQDDCQQQKLDVRKKSSVQISTKKLDFFKKNNEMFSKKKMHEYIRY